MIARPRSDFELVWTLRPRSLVSHMHQETGISPAPTCQLGQGGFCSSEWDVAGRAIIRAFSLHGFSMQEIGMSFRNEKPRPAPRSVLPIVKPRLLAIDQPVRPACPTTDDGTRGFPFIVIRLGAAVYQAEQVFLRRGPAHVSLAVDRSILQHPDPYNADGQISSKAKDLLIQAVQVAMRRTGFRMCLVWGPVWCSFVEPDGAINNSFDPPSGGYALVMDLDLGGDLLC